jgi:signal transduction histidine kinase/CheY-like chemotaxis protein
LQSLVNTLLDFSRIEVGRMRASFQPTDLAALTRELASVFRSAIEKAGIRLVVDCLPLGERVYVDRDMYEKIVLNLLSNALKFTFRGEIEVRLRDAGSAVELSVRDTGTGIAEEQLPHIFERFHRVEGVQGRTHEGTGIGLALVQELVKLHGGTVRVVAGNGSTFTVTVPKGKAHLPADQIDASRGLAFSSAAANSYMQEALRWLPGGSGQPPSLDSELLADLRRKAAAGVPRPRVVWADDNADMRDYVGRLLAPLCDVESCLDGETALAAVRREPPDLVLADVMMPRLDGFGLIRMLRADERSRFIPVILLSARAGEEARVEGLQAGAEDYLVKPFNARELVARVEAHLKSRKLIEESRDALRESEKRTVADLEAMTSLQEVGNFCSRPGSDFHQCLDKILSAAIAITSADKGNIRLFDARSGVLKITAQRGFDRAFLDLFAEVKGDEAAACREAMHAARRVVIEDITRSHIFLEQAPLRVLLDAGVRAVHSSPLIASDGSVLGMISTHFAEPHRPTERQLRLVDLLMRQAADFLERKQAEEALREAARRKDEFLATLAHELRNPLAPIRNSLHILRLAGSESGTAERVYEMMERQVNHMVRLVDDLMEVSRITSGKIELRKEQVELGAVVRSAVETSRPLIDAAHHQLAIRLPTEPLTLEGDPVRLAQVLSNLLNNAAKYTTEWGQIRMARR